MTGTRASRVLDSRSKQIPLILKASRKQLQRFFSHTLHLGTFRKFLAKSWGSYKNSRCRMRGYHTCRNRQTWSKGTGGWVTSQEGTRDFCLLRKDFRVAPRRRTFSLPQRGQIFLIWNGFPILATWVSWEKDQGS